MNPVNGDGMLSLEEFEENMPALLLRETRINKALAGDCQLTR